MNLLATVRTRPPAAAGRCVAALFAATLLLPQAGCVMHATYPPVAGGNPLTPGFPPVPEVMAKALVYAHARTGEGEPLVFNLPEGISPGVWAGVRQAIDTAIEPLGASPARPMEPGDTRVWSISQVRVRGFAAEVDVVYLDREVYQMATVHLATEPMRSYQAQYLQRWLIPIEPPVPHWPLLEATAESPVPAEDPAAMPAEAGSEAPPMDEAAAADAEAPPAPADEPMPSEPVEAPADEPGAPTEPSPTEPSPTADA